LQQPAQRCSNPGYLLEPIRHTDLDKG
jgi:hypothetical protein